MTRAGIAGLALVIAACGSFPTTIAQTSKYDNVSCSDLRHQRAFPDPAEITWHRKTEETTLPGDYLRATLVALHDFERKIEAENRGDTTPLGAFLSDVRNYDIIMSKKDQKEQYRIRFRPQAFRGEYLKGGGAAYVVDGKKLKIINKEYHM
ncbi:MAG: hypothetical protein ACREQA_08960 [Candidatus Binatia bacterium]